MLMSRVLNAMSLNKLTSLLNATKKESKRGKEMRSAEGRFMSLSNEEKIMRREQMLSRGAAFCDAVQKKRAFASVSTGFLFVYFSAYREN